LPRLAGLKAIFTSHLHLAIAAYSQRIPCFSLYVREKTKRFYHQIGHPERAVALNGATVGDLQKIIEKAEKVHWTKKDEEKLQFLKQNAQKLLKILD
jgi:polysaccharide pyruvyl transferase WcaK-like protein